MRSKERQQRHHENKSNLSVATNSLLELGINVDQDSLNKIVIERSHEEEQQNYKDGEKGGNGDNKLSHDNDENEVDTHFEKAELGVNDAVDATNSLPRNGKDGKSDNKYKIADPKLSEENDATMRHHNKDKVKKVEFSSTLNEDKVGKNSEESDPIMHAAKKHLRFD